MLRILSSVLLVSTTASCALLAPLFGGDGSGNRAESASLYQAAMADFSACETSPNAAERSAAAARLGDAARTMASISRPSDPEHFYQMDRVVAAHAHCQSVMTGR